MSSHAHFRSVFAGSLLGRDQAGDAVRLERLDADALALLARWWLPGYAQAELDRVVRRVSRDSAGLPLLASAMFEAVAGGLRLSGAAGNWPDARRTLVDTLPGDLPPAAVGALCQQFQRLDVTAREVLGAAAALGEARCVPPELSRATGLAVEEVERALDRLEWDRWLVVEARGYSFVAPIARAVLLQEMISPGQARRYRDRALMST